MRAAVILAFFANPVFADSMVAARTIRAQSVIAPEDIAMVAAEIPGALTAREDAVGQEARVTLYAGRPVHDADVGAPAVVKRNQMVILIFQVSGLTIHADGRALERGGEGDVIRVMNMSSHLTVQGSVGPDGSVSVGSISKG